MSAGAGATYVHEPDNHGHTPEALRAKRGHGAFPYLSPGESSKPLQALWDAAFAGGFEPSVRRRLAERLLLSAPVPVRDSAVTAGERVDPRMRAARSIAWVRARRCSGLVVVKSVQACLCLPWICERWSPIVLVVRRSPLNVLSSWLEMGFGELGGVEERAMREILGRDASPRPTCPGTLERVAWMVGFLDHALTEAARSLPGMLVVSHDDLCRDPERRLAAAARTLGIEWGEPNARFVREAEGPGGAYDVRRIAREQPLRWQSRLAPADVERALDVLRDFPHIHDAAPGIGLGRGASGGVSGTS